MSYNIAATGADNFLGASRMIRRAVRFVRMFRKARMLGFTVGDALRAARVNSYF